VGQNVKNYNQKCKWTGRIIITKHNWRCRMAKVGKHGQKKDVVDIKKFV